MHNHINMLKVPLLVIGLFLILNPTVASAGYKDWPIAKQAGYVVEYMSMCDQYAGMFRSKIINKKTAQIKKFYRGNSHFEDGISKASMGADYCTNCTEHCMNAEQNLLRATDYHLSKINSGNTQSAIEKCQSSGRIWNYTEDVCVANTTQTTTRSSDKKSSDLKSIENKCTELGFTKGTEKHGDCVMKLYK